MRKLLTLVIIFATCLTYSQEWSEIDDPSRFRLTEEESYEEYKESFYFEEETYGIVDFSTGLHWSGYHYPYRKGSLSETKSENVLSKLKRAGFKELSNHLKKDQDSIMLLPGIGEWGGNCHGYSQASLIYKEPSSKEVNGVHFSSGEIKSLLSYYVDYVMPSLNIDIIGERCQTDDCAEVNVASVHIALKRMIRNLGKGFVIDLDKGYKVWNYPVVEYKSTMTGENGNIKSIETVIGYLDYQHYDEETDVAGMDGQKIKYKVFNYDLEVDDDNKIIGGKWTSENYPDFIWVYNVEFPKPSGMWDIINQLNN